MFLAVLDASCGNNSSRDQSKPDKPKNSSRLNCYKYAKSGDTIVLKLIHIGESITGTLVYKLPEKNTSKGTIQGGMNGDLLVVRYTPFSDSLPIQQKVFKLTGKYFLEGDGESYNEDGQIRFKNIDDLKFIDTLRLDEIMCE